MAEFQVGPAAQATFAGVFPSPLPFPFPFVFPFPVPPPFPFPPQPPCLPRSPPLHRGPGRAALRLAEAPILVVSSSKPQI